MRRLATLFLISLLTACADSHELVRAGKDVEKLNPGQTVYVAVPSDGRYGNTVYSGSGLTTTQIVFMAFSQYANRVETAHGYERYEAALDSARKVGAAYLVVPAILEWEDRATEWSGIPDRSSIKIAVVDTSSGKTIDSVIIKGKSGLATFGGDHPQDLLPEPVQSYVSALYK